MVQLNPAPGRHALLLATALVLALPSSGWSWGGATHRYIAQHYSKHLPPQVDGLRAYDAIVYQKVNDPDIRRPSTPGEAPRHFIDIDYYPEFFDGTLTHDRAELEAQYGAATVLDKGIVPWAVGEVVATLTQQFQAGTWSASATMIADLCHYVGDATQPLHCTLNYDGQLTGNSGIHSRYETTMMSSHLAELVTPVMTTVHYPNSVDAMFDIVDASWAGVNAVIQADNTAKTASGGSYNSTYYASLWNSTETLTRQRVNEATLATASFVYTAWINAGMPPVPGSSAGVDPSPVGALLEPSPTPFREALTIRYAGTGPLTVEVFDVRGAKVERLIDHAQGAGNISWRPAAQGGAGLYFVRLTGPGLDIVRRVVRLE